MFKHLQTISRSTWTWDHFTTVLYKKLDDGRRDYIAQLKVRTVKQVPLTGITTFYPFQNYFMKHKDDHDIFNCLWWDTYHNTDVFTDPAPIWDYCTDSVNNNATTTYLTPHAVNFHKIGSRRLLRQIRGGLQQRMQRCQATPGKILEITVHSQLDINNRPIHRDSQMNTPRTTS